MSRRRRNELDSSLDIDTGYTSPSPALNSPYAQTNLASPTLEDQVEDRLYQEFMVSDDDLGGDSDLNDEKTLQLLKTQGLVDSVSMLDWNTEIDKLNNVDADADQLRGRLDTDEPFASMAALTLNDSTDSPAKVQEDSAVIDDKPSRRTPFRGSKAKDAKDSPSMGTPGVPIFRYFRNKLSKQTPTPNDATMENDNELDEEVDEGYAEDIEADDTMRDEDDGVADESQSSEDSSTESEQAEEDDYVDDDEDMFFWGGVDDKSPSWSPHVEWERIISNPLPIHFGLSMGYNRGTTHLRHLSSSSMGDSATKSPMDIHNANKLVWEHRLFLQAVWQLLTERDFIGVEGSIDLSDNIWKKGPLKKWSLAVRKNSHRWKVKYCEVRRGNLCYYEDSEQEIRKTIHLRRSDTIVQAKTDHRDGFVFEIVQSGSPTRLWMARSEDDLQAWIRTLQAAMIGVDEASVESRPLTNSGAYQSGMDMYLQLVGRTRNETDSTGYKDAIREASTACPIQVPIRWIRELPRSLGQRKDAASANGASPSKLSRSRHLGPSHKNVEKSINQFWSDMGNTTFGVNGILVPKDTPFSGERVVGALTRCILEFDKAFAEESEIDMDPSSLISELQALSFTRDILLSVFRSQQQDDAMFAVRDLLRNDKLVTINQVEMPDDAAAVHLEVAFAGDEMPGDDFLDQNEELSTWLYTRRKDSPTSYWRKRFAVLSDGVVLSYFEGATPRPHGLRGQLALNGATVEVEESCPEGREEDKYVLCVNTSDEQRWLSFEDQLTMMEWKAAIQRTIDSCAQSPPSSEVKQKKGAISMLTQPASKMIRGAKGGGIKVIRSAKDGGMKVFRSTVRILRQKQPGEMSSRPSLPRRPSMQVLMNNAPITGKRDPTVQCVAQQSYRFAIAERGETSEHLLFVQAKVFQAFLLSGGTGGRLSRGDALIEMDFDLGDRGAEYGPLDF